MMDAYVAYKANRDAFEWLEMKNRNGDLTWVKAEKCMERIYGKKPYHV